MTTDLSTPPTSPAPSDEMPLADLARAVLARELKPGVGQVRRLAEGVLTATSRQKKEKSGAKKKKGGKKRKLAKIPGGKQLL